MTQDLPLIFIGGLLGSAHCIGMCGGLALSVGASSTHLKNNFVRQLVFSIGRIATYTTLGAIAGFVGLRINHSLASLLPVQAILALLAGVLLIIQGLNAIGIRRTRVGRGQHACLLPRFLSEFLTSPDLVGKFMAGVFTGFLPCGLVYAFLAIAAASQNMLIGWATMLAFGLGTLPIMVATGLGANVLTMAARKRTFQIAGWCVILTGAISIVRGIGSLDAHFEIASKQNATSVGESELELPVAPCPFCK